MLQEPEDEDLLNLTFHTDIKAAIHYSLTSIGKLHPVHNFTDACISVLQNLKLTQCI